MLGLGISPKPRSMPSASKFYFTKQSWAPKPQVLKACWSGDDESSKEKKEKKEKKEDDRSAADIKQPQAYWRGKIGTCKPAKKHRAHQHSDE